MLKDNDKKPEEITIALLRQKKMTVATAESCTGGLVSKRITDVPGASSVFHCGIVSYANDVKMKLLGVSKATLDAHGAVSEETALEMASGILRVSGEDIGVSVTGFAGPDADEPGKKPGLIYIALASFGTKICKKLETGSNDREFNRNYSADRIFEMINEFLSNGE